MVGGHLGRANEFALSDSNNLVCSRMIGKGFGGCTFAIIKNENVDEYEKRLTEYVRTFGHVEAKLYKVKIGGKAKIIK